MKKYFKYIASVILSFTLMISVANATSVFQVFQGGTGSSTFTTGSVPFYNGTKITENNSNLFWTDASNLLTIGSVSTSGQGITKIKGGVLGGGGQTDNFLNVTGTFPSVSTGINAGVNFQISGAGSSNQVMYALRVNLLIGYTGPNQTAGVDFNNSSAGTGTTGLTANGLANFGILGGSVGVGAGHNVGFQYRAQGSSTLNLGGGSYAISAVSTPALNLGFASFALNGAVSVAGYFGLQTGNPTLGTTAALIADNGAVAADIFEARDNGTPVFSIKDAGHVLVEGVTSTGATGTGKFVFDTSPTFTTPNIGNATGNISGNAGTVTTNANLTGAVTSVGNAASLGSFTSANLSGALTDETGTGVSVFGTSPTFTTSIAVNGTATITGTNSVLLLGQNPSSSPYFSSMILKATGSNQGASMAIESTFGGVQDWYFGSGSGGGSPNNNFRIVDLTGGVEALDIQPATGNVGIGLTNPSGRLHIKAGTATAGTAPLKLTSGVNLTTPETGAMEYDGTDLFFTPTGTIRKTIPTVLTGRQTAQTAADTNVVTATVGSADASYMVSMNVLVTTATLHSFTGTVTYTDEGNTSRTVTLNFSTLAGALTPTIANAGGAAPYEGVPLHIRAKGGTTIVLATTGTFTTVTYNVEGAITLLQ